VNEEPRRSTLDETAALLDATRDAIVVLDLERRVVHCNRRFLDVFAVSAEELAARGVDAVIAAVGAKHEGRTAGLAETSPDEALERIAFRDGRVYEQFVAPHRAGGRVIGTVASYRDVTPAVLAEQTLEDERDFLEKAQQVAHVGSWVAELDGSGRLMWSAQTSRIFGLAPGEFAGTSDAFFEFVHPDDRDNVREASAAAIAGKRAYSVEHRIIRADGDVRWVNERADLVMNQAGEPQRMVGTVQDITERRTLEEELRQSQKLEAIGRLAGGVAHDLNNALTAIAGYTELALAGLAVDDPVRPDVMEIRRAAERAESVTRQLLAFSRKQLIEPRVFRLQDSVASVRRLVERLLGNDIHLHINCDAALPPIYGDPGQLEQAILNLVVNARDAMPDGGHITLEASLTVADESFVQAHRPMRPGPYVQLAVVDTGTGMSPETQSHVFEPFFTTKEVGKGTGLGLPMVYGTVKQSGGFIFVESEQGRGTTFRLFFPPAPPREAVVRKAASSRPANAYTILVVEDEPAIRNLVVTALAHHGYRVLQAPSAEGALAVTETERHIDLLLTDASMPGMGGIDLARRLVAERPELHVIVMSGYTAESLEIDGNVSLLAKPFTPRDLRLKVSEVLQQTSQ
jgi:PAS domain S-box-containing protein